MLRFSRLVERELDAWLAWYHEHRPHQGLHGRTPAAVLALASRPGAQRGRAPPRARRQRSDVRNLRPVRLVVRHVEGRMHLPIVELRRAA